MGLAEALGIVLASPLASRCLVGLTVSGEALDDAVDALAAQIASKAGSVLRRGKASFGRAATLPLAEAYAFARQQALENIAHPDAREGIAAFLEKRAPNWPGDDA